LGSTGKTSLLPALVLKYKWFGPIEVDPKDGQVVIKVPRRRDLDRMTLDVVEAYADRLLNNMKHHMHQKVRNALKYHIEREIVMTLDQELYPESNSLLAKFYDETLLSRQTNDVMKYVYDLEEIERRGFLDLLITVYMEMQERVCSSMPKESIIRETLEIFDLILDVAAKGREDVRLVHKGIVNFGIILVHIDRVDSFEYYYRRIQDYVNDHIEMVFVLGAGLNLGAIDIIAERFVNKNNRWAITSVENCIVALDGRKKIKSRCILLKSRVSEA
jgi:hypothetical protein